jgi:hypothetical protein
MLWQCENLVPEISKTSYRYVFIVLRLYSNSTDWQVHKCAIPVFEGLLPKKHDGIVHRLLFELSTWHGLAKLRLHTETTVKDLEHSTARLGNILCEFKKRVCSAYKTTELPSEEAARVRRKALVKSRGYYTRTGQRVRVEWVRIRVVVFLPSDNLYPLSGLMGESSRLSASGRTKLNTFLLANIRLLPEIPIKFYSFTSFHKHHATCL